MKKQNKVLVITFLMALLILVFLIIVAINVWKSNHKTEQEKKYLSQIIPNGYFQLEDDLDMTENKVLAISDNEKDKNLFAKEAYGNQFIWIPVENTEKYKIQEYSKYAGYQHVPIELEEMARMSFISDEDVEIYKQMCESVQKYGGFYLSRYKAGEENEKIVVKKDENVYDDIDWKEVKKLAKQFSIDNKIIGYTSSLCYEKQYEDIIMQSKKHIWNLQETNTFDEWIIGNSDLEITTMNIETSSLSNRPAMEIEPSIGFRIMIFKNVE